MEKEREREREGGADGRLDRLVRSRRSEGKEGRKQRRRSRDCTCWNDPSRTALEGGFGKGSRRGFDARVSLFLEETAGGRERERASRRSSSHAFGSARWALAVGAGNEVKVCTGVERLDLGDGRRGIGEETVGRKGGVMSSRKESREGGPTSELFRERFPLSLCC